MKVERYQLSAKQVKRLQNMYEEEDVELYFRRQPDCNDETSIITSKHFSDKILLGMDSLINMGVVGVSRKKEKVDQLMDTTKLREQQQIALELKAKKQFIEQQLQYLKSQTSVSKSEGESRVQDKAIVLSREQHQQLVLKLRKDRAQRQRNHQQFLQKLQRKSKEAEQLEKRTLEQSKKQELVKRRENIFASLEKHKKNHQQFLRVESESKQKLKNLKNHRFVYQQIEDKYQKSVVLPSLQEKKRRLKEIREYNSFNIEQLKEHEKTYLQQRQLQSSRRSDFKKQWHYRPPQKSLRFQVLLEEQRLENIKKLEEKKRQLEQKITRQDKYVSYLKQNFAPKVDPAKEEEIKQRLEKSQVVKPQAGDFKEIGMSYLQYAKRMRKAAAKTIQEPELQRSQTQRNGSNLTNRTAKETSKQTKPRTVTNYLTMDKGRDEHYEEIRRRRLQKIAKKQGLSEADRIKQLRMQAEKINEKMEQKEKELKYKKDSRLKQDTLQLLLSSIQAKIGIIQMYQ